MWHKSNTLLLTLRLFRSVRLLWSVIPNYRHRTTQILDQNTERAVSRTSAHLFRHPVEIQMQIDAIRSAVTFTRWQGVL